MAKVPSPDWVRTALRVTGHFEDSADPLGAVTGDFDGMGISLGALQWNIGSGSLQPLVRAVGRATVVEAMPHYGAELWEACTSNVANGLVIVRRWQAGATLREPVRQELRAFTRGDAFVAQQMASVARTAEAALDQASAWASSLPGKPPVSKTLFCWFFDLRTQNGGLGNLSYADVEAFVGNNGITKADDVVCDWLAARTANDAGYRDSLRNADLWRTAVDGATSPLFVLSYLRALRSRTGYRGDVLNRKATIAVGQGWVHMERHDLRSLLAG